MEIHHHPHVEKKRFKEYLLEFIMIFLAVTLGFFAETIREGITEHDRAKVFAASMLKDIETDSAQLSGYRNYFSYAADQLDTFMQLLKSADPKDIPSGKLYWYGLFGAAHSNFVPNDATFQEMKSSASLRYFKKNVASDAARYDGLCRYLATSEQMNQGLYIEARKCRAQFFDFKYLEEANIIFQENRNGFRQNRIDSFLVSNPRLLSTDKILFNQYVELCRSRFMRNYNIAGADSLLKQGHKLIGELKGEYHLEE
ncbi:MAG TPA: hypothetical protein VGI82_12650 [Chitinophagaceae bacterium]|jgi:hypothetical protein